MKSWWTTFAVPSILVVYFDEKQEGITNCSIHIDEILPHASVVDWKLTSMQFEVDHLISALGIVRFYPQDSLATRPIDSTHLCLAKNLLRLSLHTGKGRFVEVDGCKDVLCNERNRNPHSYLEKYFVNIRIHKTHGTIHGVNSPTNICIASVPSKLKWRIW